MAAQAGRCPDQASCAPPNHRLHCEQITEKLWPHLDWRAASNNLRRTLHATRRVLDSSESSRYLASDFLREESPESEQPSSDGPSSLTPREKEVAVLVTRGLTNRQIASELFLSEHTVHHHLTNILKKLALTSRQQIASHLPNR